MRRLLHLSLALAAAGAVGGTLFAAPAAGARSPPTPAAVAEAERGRARAEARRREADAEARAAQAEEGRLAALRVEAAARLRGIETEVAERAAQVADLAARRDAAATRLGERAAALGPALPLMQRLALFPAETLLAVPAPPERALLGLSVLRGVARRLERDAAALRQEQADLDAAARAVDAALPPLDAARAEQGRQARALDQQIAAARAERAGAEAAGVEAAREAAAEAARADSLRAALATLEAARARAEAAAAAAARAEGQRRRSAADAARSREAALARPPAQGLGALGLGAQGRLLQPVAGRVVRAWGDDTDAGPATGLSYRPGPRARVVAPCGGRVRFAAPFRSYGLLVILDCGGGYALVLAGLGQLDTRAGVAVLPGEPVGAMPDFDPADPGVPPSLYVELRRDGQAVDPAPFLRART